MTLTRRHLANVDRDCPAARQTLVPGGLARLATHGRTAAGAYTSALAISFAVTAYLPRVRNTSPCAGRETAAIHNVGARAGRYSRLGRSLADAHGSSARAGSLSPAAEFWTTPKFYTLSGATFRHGHLSPATHKGSAVRSTSPAAIRVATSIPHALPRTHSTHGHLIIATQNAHAVRSTCERTPR